jgi:transcriptional regulator with XRE-family HTH domain
MKVKFEYQVKLGWKKGFMLPNIGKNIKKARVIRGFTQLDLANYLGKTSQAISEVERGNAQISAIDLFKLSELLAIPIEALYHDIESDQEINIVLSLFRQLPPDIMNLQASLVKSMLEFEIQQNKFQNIDIEKTDVLEDYMREFYGHLVRFIRNLDAIRAKIIGTKTQIEDTLGLTQ